MSQEAERPQAWEALFAQALKLIGEISKYGRDDPFWTFGGGTALMLRYRHRLSKDIDIFVPDPQSLGFVTPRLSDVAESITENYAEAGNYVKPYLSEGEIDFVAAPNLTSPGFTMEDVLGYQVRVETPEEILAKKFWHRGDSITGRDIFDFALIAEREPDALHIAAKFLLRHADAVLRQLDERRAQLQAQFEAVDALDFKPTFDAASTALRTVLISIKTNNDIG